MKKILLLNPAVSSLNQGDNIISLSAQRQISDILKDSFVVNVSTHLPVSRLYAKLLKNADFEHKFVLGTNLLMGSLTGRFRQWDINYRTASLLSPCILVGAGWWQYNNEPKFWTKKIYRKILDSSYIHSVRDEYTAERLKKVGIENVAVTACPTMWDFTPEFTSAIPRSKAENVCTTLTDYNRDAVADTKMLSTLTATYGEVYLWLQGIDDFDYYSEIKDSVKDSGKIKLIAPTVEAYDEILRMPNMDYVGTRLHAGIRALQHKRRTLIIAVDNRAKEKKASFNLNVIERSEIDSLGDFVSGEFNTDIRIPINEIQAWKAQFKI